MQLIELKAELRRLFSLAFPLAAAEAGTQLMSVVDMAVVGRLGGRELAAVGLGNAVFFGVSVFGLGLMLGVDPLISQAVGARDLTSARRILWQGIWLALLTAAGLTVVLLFGPLLLHAVGVSEDVVAAATTFLLIRTIGLAPWLTFFVIRAFLQAHHVTRPMVVSVLATGDRGRRCVARSRRIGGFAEMELRRCAASVARRSSHGTAGDGGSRHLRVGRASGRPARHG